MSGLGASAMGLSIFSSIQKPNVAVSFSFDTIESEFSSNLDSILVKFRNFDILSKYINQNKQAEVSITMDLDGKTVAERTAKILLVNGESVSLLSEIEYVYVDGLDFKESDFVRGDVTVTVSHPSFSSQSYHRTFSITGVDPVAHWSLKDDTTDGSGGIVKDLSGNGFNGQTVNGVVTDANGYSGTAFSFDGSSTYVELPSLEGVPFDDSDRTVSAWVYSDENGDAYNHIFQYGTGSSNSAFSITTRSDNGLSEHTWGSTPARNSVGSVPTGQWVHLAITYNKSTDTRRYYMNGSEIGSISDQGAPDTKRNNARIGARISDLTEYWDGKIQDVRLYDVVLSEDQIKAVMKAVKYI